MKKINSKEILKIIEKNKNKLRKEGVKKIGLFGSYAQGKESKKSDIDFLIEFETIDFDRYILILNLLEKIFQRNLCIFIMRRW